MHRATCSAIAVLATCSPAWADLRNAEPIQGESVYAEFLIAFFACGAFGVFVMWAALSSPSYVRPWLLSAGSVMVAAQYLLLVSDLTSYPEAFEWYDGLFFPLYALLQARSWSSLGLIFAYTLPALGIVASTLSVPWFWRKYSRMKQADRK